MAPIFSLTYQGSDLPGIAYDVFLSTLNLSRGDDQSTLMNLPYGWGAVSELDDSGSTDSSPDGNVDLDNSTSDIMNINFGVNQGFLPVSCSSAEVENRV